MAADGWVKVYRKIIDWEWYKDANTFRVFFHLLIMANHEPKKCRGVMVGRGQWITGRKALSESLTLSDRQVRTALNHLKLTNEITIKTTSKFSIITIVNYEEYQKKDSDIDQHNDQQNDNQETSKRPANDQQTTTNKNVRTKESKNTKEYILRVIDFYNSHRKKMPEAMKVTDKRKKAIEKLLEEYGPDKVLEVIGQACKLVFFQGVNDNGWKADIDFILRPDKFLKIMEGGYKSESTNKAGGFGDFEERDYTEEELDRLIDNRDKPKDDFNNFDQREYTEEERDKFFDN
jgi:hypothetical protein